MRATPLVNEPKQMVLANGHIQSTSITVEYGRWPKSIIDFKTMGVAPGYVAKGRWP